MPWRVLLKWLAAVLELGPTHADAVRLRKRHRKPREQMLVFKSGREVPETDNVSEQALCMGTAFRKVTNRVQMEWGAKLYCGVRTVLATGRRQWLTVLAALRTALADGNVLTQPSAAAAG